MLWKEGKAPVHTLKIVLLQIYEIIIKILGTLIKDKQYLPLKRLEFDEGGGD